MPYLFALVVLVIGGVAVYFLQNNDTAALKQEPLAPATEELIPLPAESGEASASAESEVATVYVDGTYKTQETYLTPKRDEYLLDITLTVKNDIVTDAAIAYSQGAEVDPNAQRFEAAYKTEIIGKSLDSITLSRVGGASLTTGAFNKALEEIKADAAA